MCHGMQRFRLKLEVYVLTKPAVDEHIHYMVAKSLETPKIGSETTM